MINKNNLQAIKMLADKIEYTVTKTVKEARISTIDDGCAYDFYKEDLQQMYSEIEKDVICIINENTRDYYNIFMDTYNNRKEKARLLAYREKHVSKAIDLKRVGLSKRQQNDIDCVIYGEDGLCIDWVDDVDVKKKEEIERKIMDSIVVDTVTARGYSQGDYEQYTIVTYKDISKEKDDTLKCILKNLKFFFTVHEYYINLVDIETRLYTSGIEDVEEVEGDSYSTTSYTGSIDKEELHDLESQGYKIIEKY